MPHEMKDVLVVLPGILGSVLTDDHDREVWSTSVLRGLGALLTGGRAIKRLELPAGIGDEHPGDGVRATKLMPDIHVLPGIWSVNVGYERLRQSLTETYALVPPSQATADRPANYIEFPYDWRLSNRYNAKLLKTTVEPALDQFRTVAGHEDARLIFLTHSMGGLIARYFTDVLGGNEITRKVVTMGTPHRGALNALESLVNGVRKDFAFLSIDITDMSRSLPSLYQLLPEYACVEQPGGLAKLDELDDLPEVDAGMLSDAVAFHAELQQGAKDTAATFHAHPILARTQPTGTTARLVNGRVLVLQTINGENQAGDGTVPRLSAAPYGVASDDPVLRYVMEKHGTLPSNESVHIELEGILTGSSVIPRPVSFELGVQAEDVLLAGETLDVEVTAEPGLLVEVVLAPSRDPGSTAGPPIGRSHLTDDGSGSYRHAFKDLPPGGYALEVRVSGGSPAETVTTPIMVFPPVEP